jgi:hypothetical protein
MYEMEQEIKLILKTKKLLHTKSSQVVCAYLNCDSKSGVKWEAIDSTTHNVGVFLIFTEKWCASLLYHIDQNDDFYFAGYVDDEGNILDKPITKKDVENE